MRYKIITPQEFEANFLAADDGYAIRDMIPTMGLRDACEAQASAYADQYDSSDTNYDEYWDVAWATGQYEKLMKEWLEDREEE